MLRLLRQQQTTAVVGSKLLWHRRPRWCRGLHGSSSLQWSCTAATRCQVAKKVSVTSVTSQSPQVPQGIDWKSLWTSFSRPNKCVLNHFDVCKLMHFVCSSCPCSLAPKAFLSSSVPNLRLRTLPILEGMLSTVTQVADIMRSWQYHVFLGVQLRTTDSKTCWL